MGERERERDREDGQSVAASMQDDSVSAESDAMFPPSDLSAAQRGIDSLFDRTQEKSMWKPVRASEPLGELLDSCHMLPLVLPSDPRLLAALPVLRQLPEDDKRHRPSLSVDESSRSASRASFGTRGAMAWRLDARRLREVGIGTLQRIDGTGSAKWTRMVEFDETAEAEAEADGDEEHASYTTDIHRPMDYHSHAHLTPLTRRPSTRSRGRASVVGDEATPVERRIESLSSPLAV